MAQSAAHVDRFSCWAFGAAMKVMPTMQERVRHIRELVDWVEDVQEDAERIISLVRKNQEFFGATPGSRCMRNAADTLERLVREAKQ
jgi:hypothetical protein